MSLNRTEVERQEVLRAKNETDQFQLRTVHMDTVNLTEHPVTFMNDLGVDWREFFKRPGDVSNKEWALAVTMQFVILGVIAVVMVTNPRETIKWARRKISGLS